MLGEALEQLIYERTQLQWAQQNGLKVTDEEVDQLERSVADRNQLTLTEFRAQLEREGLSLTQYRQSLRQQQILQRLREREAACCPEDVPFDEYIATLTRGRDEARNTIAHWGNLNYAQDLAAQVAGLGGLPEFIDEMDDARSFCARPC